MTNIEKAQTISEIVDSLDKIKELADEISIERAEIYECLGTIQDSGCRIPDGLLLQFISINNYVGYIKLLIEVEVMPDLEKLA